VGKHSPTEVDSARDRPFHSDQIMRLRIDPYPSLKPGKRLRLRAWWIEFGIWLVVEHDLQCASVFAGLRLPRSVAIECRIGHKWHHRVSQLLLGLPIPYVLEVG
jgi:hypothetical protein